MIRAPRSVFLAASLILALTSATVSAITIHVPGDQPTIDAGLGAAVAGDTVLVACGTYNESNLLMKSGVCLRGETGDPACVTIDAQSVDRVMQCNGVDAAASVEGITLTGGSSTLDGGGVFCANSFLTFTACAFDSNQAQGRGGALESVFGSHIVLNTCSFTGNQAAEGGGLAALVNGSLELVDCDIVGNYSSGSGSGVYAQSATVLSFAGCRFEGNDSPSGGCLYSSGSATPVEVVDCRFIGNSTGCMPGGELIGAVMNADPELSVSGSIFASNGNDHCFSLISADAGTITGSTFHNNTSFYSIDLAAGSLENSIFSWNYASSPGIGGFTASCTNCWFNFLDWEFGMPPGAGNLAVDPIYCDADSLDLTLYEGSPCLPEANPGCGLIGALGQGCVPSITLLYPNGGESFAEGDSVSILWEGGIGTTVDIDLLRDGQVCESIASGLADSGQFDWIATTCAREYSGYSIRITINGLASWDESDADFEVHALRLGDLVDIAPDQGGQLRVSWPRTYNDAPGTPYTVTSYSLWRRVDDRERLLAHSTGGAGEAQPLVEYPPGNWDWVATVPASGQDGYSLVSPTLCDSTAEGGICWSAFFLSAQTPDPFVYFVSLPDSGYSADNLHPAPPANFLVSYGEPDGNGLSWDESGEPDFDYFNIYRGDADSFEPSEANRIHQTSGTNWADTAGGAGHHYKIAAVDFSGNEGEAAGPDATTGSPGGLPEVFALHQNNPNPFNPATEIRFDLPIASKRVTLTIFDVAGRTVRTLHDGPMSAGRHSVAWRGRDDRGRGVSSGVYFYRLDSPGVGQTRKMLLLQ
jgi:hypothetical protein